MSRHHHRKHGRAVWQRIFLWILIILFMSLAFGALYLFYVPITSPRLRNRIAQELEQATNSRVEIERARYFAGRGDCEIDDISFRDDALSSEPVFQLKSVRLSVSPLALLFGGSGLISSAELREPSPITYDYDSHTLHPRAEAAFLHRLIHKPQNARIKRSTNNWRVRVVDVSVELHPLHEQSTLPRVTTSSEVLALRGATLNANSRGGLLTGEFSGLFSSAGLTAPVEGRLSLGAAQSVAASLLLQNAKLNNLGPGLRSVAAENLNVDLLVNPTPTGFHTTASLHAAAAEFQTRSGTIQDRELSAYLEAGYTTDTAELDLSKIQMKTAQLQLEGNGAFELGGDARYSTQFAATVKGATYQTLAAQTLFPESRLQFTPEKLEVQLAATGSRKGVEALTGHVGFTNVAIESPDMTERVVANGSIDVGDEQLTLQPTTLIAGETSATINGTLESSFWKEGKGAVGLNWTASGDASNLMAFLPGIKNVNITGPIETAGAYTQLLHEQNGVVSADPPRLQGEAFMQNVSVNSSHFPAPITELTGPIFFREQQVFMSNVQGKIRQSTVRLTANIAGQENAWKDPQLTATLVSDLKLTDLVEYLPAEQKRSLLPHKIRGLAQSTLSVAGPLRRMSEAAVTGKVRLIGASFVPRLTFMAGEWRDVGVDAIWDGNILRLNNFTANINGEQVRGAGLLSRDNISIDLRGSADLANMLKTFPGSQRFFEAGGPASYDLRFSAVEVESPPQITQQGFGGRIVPLLTQVTDRLNAAVANHSFKLQGYVDFGNETGRAWIRHAGMPPERTDSDGDRIPRGEITNIYGRATVDDYLLRIPEKKPVQCDFTGARKCQLSGEIEYRPDNYPRIDFRIVTSGEAAFDAWISGWGKGLSRPPTPIQGHKVFELSGNISAPRGVYKGVPAGPVRVQLSYTAPQGKPRLLNLRQVQIQGENGGSLNGTGEVRSFPWDPANYPQWRVDVSNIRDMPLLPMLIWVFRDVSSLDGIASGDLKLHGVGRNPHSIQGAGSMTLSSLAIGKTELMRRVGETAGRSFEGQYFGTAHAAHFDVSNGTLSSNDLLLNTKGIELSLRGEYYFARQANAPARGINASMQLNLFETVLGRIPLVGPIAKLADRVAGKVLMEFRVSGTVDDPRVTPVMLPLLQGTDTINTY